MAKKKQEPDDEGYLQSPKLRSEIGGTSFKDMHREVERIVIPALTALFERKGERYGKLERDQMLQLISGDIRHASMLAIQGKVAEAQKIARRIDYEAAYRKMKSEE